MKLHSYYTSVNQYKNYVKLLFIPANLSMGSETDTYPILVTPLALMFLSFILSGNILMYFLLLNIW